MNLENYCLSHPYPVPGTVNIGERRYYISEPRILYVTHRSRNAPQNICDYTRYCFERQYHITWQ